MLKNLIEKFTKNNAVLYATIVSTYGSILATFITDFIQAPTFLILFTTLSIILFLYMLYQQLVPSLKGGGSYNGLIHSLPKPLISYIDNSSSIYILGGFLTEFVRFSDVIEKLNEVTHDGGSVRILLLDPLGDTIPMITRERSARKGRHLDQQLQLESLDSISRLADVMDWHKVSKIVRLYNYMPHSSVHKFGDHYFITTYTYGRGGSSPGLHFKRSDPIKRYCAGLDKGFDELWNAETTKKLTKSYYEVAHKKLVTKAISNPP